ncbi:MAG: hypothetical protein J1E78_03905 [Muribaculaceae bacterium]|nr:hypothetical protein [Muribaculaceae bacterium]
MEFQNENQVPGLNRTGIIKWMWWLYVAVAFGVVFIIWWMFMALSSHEVKVQQAEKIQNLEQVSTFQNPS